MVSNLRDGYVPFVTSQGAERVSFSEFVSTHSKYLPDNRKVNFAHYGTIKYSMLALQILKETFFLLPVLFLPDFLCLHPDTGGDALRSHGCENGSVLSRRTHDP